MTIKKNFARDYDEERRKPRRNENHRKEQKIKHALRHGDVTVLEDDYYDDAEFGIVDDVDLDGGFDE